MLIELVLALTGLTAQAQATQTCSAIAVANGTCSITNSGSSVDIGGTRPGAGGGGNSAGNGATDDPGSEPPATEPPECVSIPTRVCGNGFRATLVNITPTLTDVASFAPASVPVADEPDGIGVVGMPMNFVVGAESHESTGALFGLPVTVRFTPASVLFTYGDGGTRTAPSGGRTWAQLGLAQFSPTPTSHAYAERGTYTASAVVRYSATVDFGNGWIPVPGLLEIPTPATTVSIVEVRTALVDRTCLEDPLGPGC
ncbi:MAG: hypothetical protein DI566_03525 [Microbacterium sp.]|nr:MAG: hypothetical protein DI566_03525 [Microbacterium sp.]